MNMRSLAKQNYHAKLFKAPVMLHQYSKVTLYLKEAHTRGKVTYRKETLPNFC